MPAAPRKTAQNVYPFWDGTPPQIKLTASRQLSAIDLDRIGPTSLYVQLLRNRLCLRPSGSNVASYMCFSQDQQDEMMTFLHEECTGLFFVASDFNLLMFELDTDMLHFKLRFEGRSV